MKFIPDQITRSVGRQALLTKKHSPTVLFASGLVGVVSSTVLACHATLKLEEVLEETKKNKEIAHYTRENHENEYSADELSKDLAIIQVRGVVAVAKLYAPAVVVGVFSIAALTKSHTILNDRVAAVTAAYAALERGFDEYRARVIDKYGEDEDRQLRFPREKIKEINPETGREHSVTIVGDDSPSIYARFFDPASSSWQDDPELNLIFLTCQQQYANDRLHARGHLFLNEVYDDLGIPRSQAGQVVGWVLNENGDNFVDFGIFDLQNESKREFVNGREGSILLDFNVDGMIHNKI